MQHKRKPTALSARSIDICTQFCQYTTDFLVSTFLPIEPSEVSISMRKINIEDTEADGVTRVSMENVENMRNRRSIVNIVLDG